MIFLQVLVILMGISVLVFMIWEPPHEGRNINATLFEAYFMDPFLAYIYIGSLPFFVGFYQVFKLLGSVGQGKLYSESSVRALRTIKYCALITAVLVMGAEVYIILSAGNQEDYNALGFFVILTSIIIAAVSAKLERKLEKPLK